MMELRPSGTAGAYVAAVLASFPTAKGITYAGFASPYPAIGIFLVGDTTVCQSYGVSDLGGGLSTAFGSWAPIPVLGTAWTSAAFLTQALRMQQLLYATMPGRGGAVICCGHSWGGASAQVLAGKLATEGNFRDVQCLSLGSPKAGNSGLVGLLRDVTCLRLMLATDLVAASPPSISEAPLLYASTPFLVAVYYSLYQHGPGGVVVAADGSWRAANGPGSVAWGAIANLQTVAVSGSGALGTSHWLGSYLANMTSWAAAPPTTQVIQTPAPPTPAQITVTEYSANRDALLNPSGESESVEVAYIPPEFLARVNIAGSHPRLYNVWWMGLTITKNATKSNAHTVAKNWNRLLRRLLTDTTLINTAAFQESWSNWLVAAANPANGITPTLNVGP
jgi:pimeloyl-ACP methyl ester carboxylesterase